MSMNPQNALNAVKSKLNGTINFNKAPAAEKMVKAIVEAVLTEVTKAAVNVPAGNLTTAQGPVKGSTTGTIS